jgi:hypothetical protein
MHANYLLVGLGKLGAHRKRQADSQGEARV